MLEEQATVVAVDGEHAWVETERASGCGQCSSRQGCGTAALGQVMGNRTTRVRALNAIEARPGDRVVIALREDALVGGSVVVYLLPLAGLISGAGVFQLLVGAAGPEWPVVLGGVLGLIGGLWGTRRVSRRMAGDPRYQPELVRNLSVVGVPTFVKTPRAPT